MHNSHQSSLYWDDVGFDVKDKTIISNCSGILYSGQLVGILGPSGSGKSTLLNCLSGRLDKGCLKGTILYDGKPRVKRTWKTQCGFAEQDEVMYRNLTVKETLMYAALLKLPTNLCYKDKVARVELMIKELGLAACQHTRIGDPDNKGISGGERKRVAIGVEMISDPSVFFLDEPTSGLDAFTALDIVQTLKNIAVEKNRLTLMTIHQPRNELLNIFDAIMVLANGKMVFFGSIKEALLHFEELGYYLPSNTNPSDFFLDICAINRHTPELEKDSLDRIAKFQSAWAAKRKKYRIPPPISLADSSAKKYKRTWIGSFMTLLSRNMKDSLRDKTVLFINFIQTVLVMLFIGLIYKDVSNRLIDGLQNRLGVLVFMGLYNTFMNVLPTVLIFPNHRQIIRRERAAGTYPASAAYLAKFTSLIPFSVLSSLILSAPIPFFVGLKRDAKRYSIFIASFLLQSLASSSFGLMIGAGVTNGTTGLLIAFPLLIVMFLFGGLLLNLTTLHPSVYWIQFISLIANCMKAIAQGELKNSAFEFQTSAITVSITNDLANFVENFNLNSPSVMGCLAINAGLMAAFNLIGYLVFRFTAAPKSNLGNYKNHDSKTVPGLKNVEATPNIPLQDMNYDGASVLSHSTITVTDQPDFVPPPVSLGENRQVNRGRDLSGNTSSEFPRLPRTHSLHQSSPEANFDMTNASIPNKSKASSPPNSITLSDLSYFNA